MKFPLILLLVSAEALAQPLEQFLEAAASQNVDVQLGAAATARAAAEAGQVWGTLLPSLSVSAAYVRNERATAIEVPAGPSTRTLTIAPLNQLEASVRVELPLIDVNRWVRTAASSASARAAEQREAGAREQVSRQVILAYYAAASASALLESTLQSVEVARAQLDQQHSRSQAGVSTELEVVRATAELLRNEQVVADARAAEANARRALASLTGLEAATFPPLAADDLHLEAPLAELERNVPQLASVRAAQTDVDAAQRARAAAATVLIPSVSAQATQRFTNATGFQDQSASWNAGLELRWRLDVSAVQAIRAAGASAQLATLTEQKARLAARDQIHADWQRTLAAGTKLRAARGQAVASRRAAALAAERNAAGVATQLEVISADRDRLLADVSEIMARFELASARACLRLSANLAPEVAR